MHLAKGPQKVFVEWKVKTFQGFLFLSARGIKLAACDHSSHFRQRKTMSLHNKGAMEPF